MSDTSAVMSWLLAKVARVAIGASVRSTVTPYIADMAGKCACGMQARQLIQLGKQQEKLLVNKSAGSGLASQVNKVVGDDEHLQAHVAVLEAQHDSMLHELQNAAALQVMLHTTKLPGLLWLYVAVVLPRL